MPDVKQLMQPCPQSTICTLAEGDPDAGPDQMANGHSHKEEAKAKPARAIKNPLQKEALEAAYNSEGSFPITLHCVHTAGSRSGSAV